MADVKWSDNAAFTSVGNSLNGDFIMGLRSGNNVKFQGGFLLGSNNLSDLKSNNTTLENIGLGNSVVQVITGDITLTNPSATRFSLSFSGTHTIKLAPAQGSQALRVGTLIIIFNFSSGTGNITDSVNNAITTIEPNHTQALLLTDNSTPQGSWIAIETFTAAAARALFSANSPLVYNASTGVFEIDTMDSGQLMMGTSGGNAVIGDLVAGNNMTIDTTTDGQIILNCGMVDTISLQNAYDNGLNAEVNLQDDRPIVINTISSSSSINAVTTPSTGTNVVANYRVCGWVFTVSSNRNITALQYQDSNFTQPGTRTVCIWIKSTQELLGSAVVSKTDPLDGSSIYRTKVLDTPIPLTTGVEYVVSVVVPGNENNNVDQNAVPGSGMSIIQSAVGPASGMPLPALTFPASFLNETNSTYAGFFQFETFTASESINFNDQSTNDSQIMSISSTTRATHLAPSMTISDMNGIASPTSGDSVFITDDPTSSRTYQYDGSSWMGLAYYYEINLQNAYNNGSTINLSGSLLSISDTSADNSIVFSDGSSNPLMYFYGTTNSTVPYSVLTDAKFSSISSIRQGMIGYTTTSNRLSIYNGMSVKQLAYTDDTNNSGTFTPGITNVSNTSSISFIKGMYAATGTTSGKVITCSLQFSCSVSGSLCTVQIASLPVSPGNFVGTGQAMAMGGFIYLNGTPNIGDGQILDVISNNGATTLNFSFLTANNTGTKVITISFRYIIQ